MLPAVASIRISMHQREAIEGGVGDGGIPDDFVPAVDMIGVGDALVAGHLLLIALLVNLTDTRAAWQPTEAVGA